MIVDSLVIEKFLNGKMIIAGNHATMQLPIESLKNIQTFYLFIPQFQNMKFIYSSLQRKSCSRCCSYISIMWLFKTIFRHVCLWHRFLPQSTYRYPSLLKEPIMHLHNSLSMRPSLGISEEEFHLSLFASVVSLSPLQKSLILRLALGRGLALLVRVGASSVSLPSQCTLK